MSVWFLLLSTVVRTIIIVYLRLLITWSSICWKVSLHWMFICTRWMAYLQWVVILYILKGFPSLLYITEVQTLRLLHPAQQLNPRLLSLRLWCTLTVTNGFKIMHWHWVRDMEMSVLLSNWFLTLSTCVADSTTYLCSFPNSAVNHIERNLGHWDPPQQCIYNFIWDKEMWVGFCRLTLASRVPLHFSHALLHTFRQIYPATRGPQG